MKHFLQQGASLDGETRVLVLRRHWFLFFQRALLLALAAVLPPVILALLFPNAWQLVLDRTAGGTIIVMAFTIFVLILCLNTLHAWVEYALDVWIVSNKRIVNIEQRGLFSRVVSELLLDKVQDVTVEVHGILPTMLKFGDVHIQTAGENPRFHFDDIPNPHKVAEMIMELHRSSANTAAQSPAQQVAQE